MTENEATREMTFEEEYEILQKEKEELFAMENCDSEPPFANCVVRRASRCIGKLFEEIQQYRAIGTVEDIEKSMQNVLFLLAENEVLKLYQAIGTIEEIKALKEKSVAKKMDRYYCPICRHYFEDGELHNYCPECGQALEN